MKSIRNISNVPEDKKKNLTKQKYTSPLLMKYGNIVRSTLGSKNNGADGALGQTKN